jgi:hypothetical protein
MFYKARWFDPALGRFLQPDTIVPLASQGVMAHDRYAGMNNNPVRYNDPSGHDVGCAGRNGLECGAQPSSKAQPSSTPSPTKTRTATSSSRTEITPKLGSIFGTPVPTLTPGTHLVQGNTNTPTPTITPTTMPLDEFAEQMGSDIAEFADPFSGPDPFVAFGTDSSTQIAIILTEAGHPDLAAVVVAWTKKVEILGFIINSGPKIVDFLSDGFFSYKSDFTPTPFFQTPNPTLPISTPQKTPYR